MLLFSNLSEQSAVSTPVSPVSELGNELLPYAFWIVLKSGISGLGSATERAENLKDIELYWSSNFYIIPVQ